MDDGGTGNRTPDGNLEEPSRGFSPGRIASFAHDGWTWYWNGFWGFFFQPAGPERKRERIVEEGHRLYPLLREAAGYT